MNSSSDAAPTSCSIARVSSGLGPMWRATKRSAGSREARAVGMMEGLFANLLLVLLAPQELVELFRILDPEPDHPALAVRSEEHTSELQSLAYLVCRLLLEKKKKQATCLSAWMLECDH